MSGTIHGELVFFFQSFSYGLSVLLAYDVLRAFRRVFRRGFFLLSLEDFLFFTFSFIGFFLLIQWENDGAVRGFSIAALAFGMAAYHFLLSKTVLFTLTFTVGKVKRAVCFTVHTLFRPLSFLAEKCRKVCQKPLKKLEKRVKMALQRKRGKSSQKR